MSRKPILAVCGLALVGAVLALPSQPASAAGLLVADGGFGGQLEIKEHEVQVTINNGIAVTQVEQVFVNTENRIVEALYTFPVPQGASVANFSMWIDGKEMIGEVVEKERARRIYESYKATRVDPGLLEQVDYKRFEMRIFPIAAGAEQRVQVTYYQELDFDHDQATYVYPLGTTVAGADSAVNADSQRTTGTFSLALHVRSTVPILSLSSPSHGDDFVTVEHSPQYYEASLETPEGDLNRDVVLYIDAQRPRTGFDLITSKQPGEDGYFQLTLTAGQELEELNRGMDYVFILDISGSMANDGKLRLSQNALQAFFASLAADDLFELISFNVAPSPLWNELHGVDDDARKQAAQFLSGQRARGGTSLRPAVEAAYRYDDPDRVLNVVILSDGMTEEAEQGQLLQLIGQRPAGARVFCIGVGNEVNRPLLAQLAEQAGGLSAFISRGDDFDRAASAFRRKLMRPAATNVRFDFSGVEVHSLQPEALPNLYHGAPLRLYGRYREGGNCQVTFRGDVLGQPIEQTVTLNLPRENPANPQIDRMWAYRRVEQLMRAARLGGPLNREEIVRLCEEYSITSEYASFIVLENDAEYRRWKIERRNANRIQRDRQVHERLNRELAQLRQRSLGDLGPAPSTGNQPAANQVASAPTTPGLPNVVSGSPAPSSGNRGFDIQVSSGGSGGGGAIDPLSGTIALGLAGAAAAAARKRRAIDSQEGQGQPAAG